jgi:acetyl esterase/lipase
VTLNRGAERLLAMLATAGAERRRWPTPAERRAMLAVLGQRADGAAAGVDSRELILPGPGGRLRARLYARADASAGGLVFFHGGGWVAGGLDTHDGLCRRLAASSAVKVLAIDYRLAPESPFPAAVEDALAATCWAAEHAHDLGVDPARLAVGGDSVGAGLAAVVAQDPAAPALAAQVLICPVLDLVNETQSRRDFAEGYFLDPAVLAADLKDYCGAATDLRDPRLSPLLAPDLARAAPALIHSAQYDPFRDEAAAYARRLGDAGVACRYTCWYGMIHYFYCLSRSIPGSARVVCAIGAELAEALA